MIALWQAISRLLHRHPHPPEPPPVYVPKDDDVIQEWRNAQAESIKAQRRLDREIREVRQNRVESAYLRRRLEEKDQPT